MFAISPSVDSPAVVRNWSEHNAGRLDGYEGPPANPTQGDANLAQLAMTAQFYRQDAVAAPNLTHLGPNLAQLRTTQQ